MLSACGNNNTDVKENTGLAQIEATASPTAVPSDEEKRITFEIENKTGKDFEKIYISESGTEMWEESLLPSDGKFEDGNTVKVSVPKDDTTENHDIKTEDSDGNFVYWQNIDLKNAGKITLKLQDGKPLAEIE